MTKTLPRLPTGIPGLDTILGGGFIEGASYILRGHPGAGKTIAANQIAYSSVANGLRVLYVTLLAETHDRLFQALSTLEFFDKAQLGSKTHWKESGDLSMMFRGAYDSRFYRDFRDLLHRQVELLQPAQAMAPGEYREACDRLLPDRLAGEGIAAEP